MGSNHHHPGLSNSQKSALTDEERFWGKVEKTDTCWLWTGAICSDGYGSLRRSKGPTWSAHRLSWQIHFGGIPDNLSVLHKCDVRACVNPEHLFLGTQKDNVRDCVSKGRNNTCSGSKHRNAKLNENLVREFRGKYKAGQLNVTQLARDLGMQRMTLFHMLWGKTWKHVEV